MGRSTERISSTVSSRMQQDAAGSAACGRACWACFSCCDGVLLLPHVCMTDTPAPRLASERTGGKGSRGFAADGVLPWEAHDDVAYAAPQQGHDGGFIVRGSVGVLAQGTLKIELQRVPRYRQ